MLFQLVTLFSAPNYCGEFDNAAAVMIVTADLTCSFKILPVSLFGILRWVVFFCGKDKMTRERISINVAFGIYLSSFISGH